MKSRKKILILLVGIISIFGLSNVKADTKKIEIKDITVKEKSGTITAVDPVINENEITSNITFNEVDDFVTFDMTLKNNEDEKYKIDSIVDNNNNNNIKIDYTFSKDFINKGETTKVAIKLTYKNKLLNVDKISLNDLTIKINLVKEDGSSEEIIINPVTGDNIFHYLVLLIIALTGLIFVIAKKNIFKLKIGNLLIVLAFLLIPFVTFASEKYEVQVKFTNLDIIGEFETYNITINPNNGTTPVVKNITYGDPIGELPADPNKDGYTFDKWVDGNGNEVTPETVITSEISVEAKYNIIEYNITYDLGDGNLPSGKTNPSKYTIEDEITLNNPVLAGYTFTGWTGTEIDTQTTSVTIAKGSKDARSYVAHYSANDDTPYKVIHKYANLTGGYDDEEITEHGTTGSTVPAPRQSRTGFITPTVQNVTIAGDGQASITYTYEREEYAFSITDRTYINDGTTADGTYPYGTSITVKAQERAGYTFTWSDGNSNYERTFELENIKELTPIYTANTNTPYTVKHYKQKLTLDGYDIETTQNLSGTTDSPISPAVNTYTGFTSPSVQSTTISGNGDTLVEYYYDREMYTLSFNNNENVTSTKAAGSYPYGTQITLTANTIPGYTFTKWSNDETNNPYTFTLTRSVTLEPEYQANTDTPYTVEHKKQNLNDLTKYTTANTDNLSGTTGTNATPDVKFYEGFTAPSTQTKEIKGDGSTSFEYLYTRNQYALTITHPEYVVEDKSGNYYYEEQVSLTAIDRAGYTFAGWSSGEDTKTITVTMGANNKTVEPLYTANDDTTYKVIHKYAKLTSGYDTEEITGTGTTGSTIPAPRQPRTGFVTPNEQSITIAGDGNASVTYTYERDTYTFSIADRTYLDESVSTPNDTYPYETTITLKATAREGYSFKWSDDVTNLERTFELTENVTLSLVYTANEYTLTANAHEGTIAETSGWTGTGETATKTITYDSTYGTLPIVEREGYTLAGWNTAEDGTGTDITSSTTVSTLTNQAIYAQWIINSYSVTFDTDGGSVVTGQTVNHGGHATRPAVDPEKEGFEFNGWYTTDEYETEFDFENTPITSATIIYAKFIEIDQCIPFATDSWSTIKTNIESDSNYYPIGCQKEVEMDMNDDSTPESYTVRLANTSTPEVCATEGYSQTACGTVIEFVDIVALRQLTSTRTNEGGWKATPLVTWVNNDLYDKLPSDLKSVIIPTYPIVSGSGSGGNSPDITSADTTINKLYLLSGREVGFDLSNDNKKDVTTDTRTLDYYLTIGKNSQRIKYDLDGEIHRWWLRTPYSGHDARFYGVYETGTYGFDYGTDNSTGVAPAFRIGTVAPSKYTVSFDTDGGSEVPSQTINSGGTVTRPTTDPTKTGYVFDDWYTTDQYTTKFDFENTAITEDTTIYAKFDELKVCADNENITTLSSTTCSNNENIKIGDGIVCKRAVKLHEETCSQTDGTYYCSGAGYTESGSKGTSTITYGSCGTSGTLSSGDAFTCDVNGDGDFDELTERFYYVSDYYDTSAKEFDDSTAVLIYYNNVTSGVSCNKNKFAYDSSNENWHGPRTLVSQLPTTSQWSNVSLKSETRAILAEYLSTHDSPTTAGGTLPTDFSYEGYAARLLTAKELTSGCNLIEVGGKTTGELDSCNYIMENTRYAKSTIGNSGTWLETPYAFDSDTVWYVGGYYRSVRSSSTNNTNFGGARPAIEVPKSAIAIGNLPQYTVSFNSDGGSTIADIEVDAGDSINELPTPTKADSVFVGWFESVSDENPVTEPYTPSGDITLIAKWNNIICKKATDLHEVACAHTDGGKGCRKNHPQENYTYGNIIDSDTFESGDVLDCDVDGTGYNQRFYYMRTIDDKAVLISYTDFEGDSGQGNTQSYKYATALTKLPTTTQWDNLPVTFESGTQAARLMTYDDLIYACGNGSTVTNSDLVNCEYIFEDSGYESTTTGRNGTWIAESGGTYRRIQNSQVIIETPAKGVDSENTVKPVIEVPLRLIEDSYVVRFDANGGTVSSEYKNVKKGSTLGTLPTATKTNYVVKDWYASLGFTEVVNENTIPIGYVTYYAKWVKRVQDMIIDSDSYSFEIGDTDSITITDTEEIEPMTFESNDTSVVTVDSNGNLEAVGEGTTTITITGTKSETTRTINVRVVPELTDFTVSFDSQGGPSVADIPVPKNTAIGPLPEPTWTGYVFAGWFTNTNFSVQVTESTVIRGNVTFFAKWIPENKVAEINNTYYDTIQDAVDDAPDTKTTIKILKDVELSSFVDLFTKNTSKDIVLDLQGHIISVPSNKNTQTIRTKTTLEIKNGTVTNASNNGTVDVGVGGRLIINDGFIENTGSRAAIYNDGGTVEIGGTVILTSNALWASNNKRGTVQNKAGITTITGGTITNVRSSDSYGVAATVGTLIIGTQDDIYDTQKISIQGETSGIYSDVSYSLYDGYIKGKNTAVNNEGKIANIETGSVKVNDTDGGYQTLYYTMPVTKYRIDLDAGAGEVNPTYLLIDDGDQLGTLPTPTRGVYTFDGWFDANDVEADPSHTPTGNETYYAKWHYEVSSEIVEFRTTNNAMKTYYNKIDEWKGSASNFPSWSDSNNSPNWALDATENTAMKANFDSNNCMCADNQCTSAGTVECDKPNGYSTGFNESVSVYLSDENTKAKGAQVSYAKSSNGTIQNLIPNQVYYWELDSDPSVYGYVKFVGERRILDTGDVRNTRDLGGLPVDLDGDNVFDGELKYEKLYRGIKLSSASSVTELANLGITEELDLRNQSDADANKLSDITGKKYHQIETQNYYINPDTQSSTELQYYNWTRSAVKYAMEEIVNDESLYFHCRIGTDRTGTVAYILEGLLGVPEEYRVQDYELSFFYGLIRIHRYHDQKPGSSVGTGHERFVYMHNFMPDNDDIYDWYMAGTTNQQEDEDLINAFRAAMINSY